LFEQALNTQALRLAADPERPVGELEPHHLKALTAADVAAAARALGEERAGPAVPRFRWRRSA
jgi:hypothetical protein